MSRHFCLRPAVIAVLLCFAPVFSQPVYDLLLKGGTVIDPANNRNRVLDVAIKDKKIALVDSSIEAQKASRVIGVNGNFVSPGFVDIHTHVFHTFTMKAGVSLVPDSISFPFGVTTVVDAGCSGALTFEKFKRDVIDKSKTRVLAFLNISRDGMNDISEDNPATFDVPAGAAMARKYPNLVVGFKSAHYWVLLPFDGGHPPWSSVDSVLVAGRTANLPVMIDFEQRPSSGGFPARTYRDLLRRLRPGDIHTHCLAAHIPSLMPDGTVDTAVINAQKRGIIFDLGHGAGSFVFAIATPAFKQGYFPNSISTDMHKAARDSSAKNMLHVMSKLLCMGMPLEEVIRRSTINPAMEIKHPELGNLSIGSPADIAVFKVLQGTFIYEDKLHVQLKVTQKLECKSTVFGGDIVYGSLPVKTILAAPQTGNPVKVSVLRGMISYSLSHKSSVSIAVYTISGRTISSLSGYQQAGDHTLPLCNGNCARGAYVVNFRADAAEKRLLVAMIR
jgi:dihydroorotase